MDIIKSTRDPSSPKRIYKSSWIIIDKPKTLSTANHECIWFWTRQLSDTALKVKKLWQQKSPLGNKDYPVSMQSALQGPWCLPQSQFVSAYGALITQTVRILVFPYGPSRRGQYLLGFSCLFVDHTQTPYKENKRIKGYNYYPRTSGPSAQ